MESLKTYKITYLNYEGDVRWLTIEAEDKEGAEINALRDDSNNIGGDGIYKIIEVEEQ